MTRIQSRFHAALIISPMCLSLAYFSHIPLARAEMYKCVGNGTTAFTQTPCPTNTKQESVVIKDASSAQEQQRVEKSVERDKKEARTLEKNRHQLETKRDKEIASNIKRNDGIKKKCDAQNLRLKWAQEDLRNAPPKTEEKAKQKLKRLTEKSALTCPAN